MNLIFQACVVILYWLGDFFGLSYIEINVILFCFLMPAVFIYMAYRIYTLKKQLKILQLKSLQQ
jgi:hypothetical protein